MRDCYIVTGTTSGLGLSFVTKLLKEEALVYSISRKENDAVKELKQLGLKHFNCDLANIEELNATISQVFDKLRQENVQSYTLINNAGTINPIGDVGTHDVMALANNIDTNIKAPIVLMEAFIKELQDADLPKYILNISSGAGRKPYAGWATYCASKAGLDLFSACVGKEQETQLYPIKVISFAPGVVDTNMQVTIRSTKKEDFNAVTRFIDLKNNKQLLSPSFVAQQLLELLPSDQTLNGGLYDIRDFIDEKQK
ncbi:MAG: (S)-benzoin forming benzil reductase [Flavobacteriales bacterium]|jgi:benzil reductase ((S)-benzoin forming)|nr:(S)-benzoin forming benzil reductase [Flavobacteriales bacterium]